MNNNQVKHHHSFMTAVSKHNVLQGVEAIETPNRGGCLKLLTPNKQAKSQEQDFTIIIAPRMQLRDEILTVETYTPTGDNREP